MANTKEHDRTHEGSKIKKIVIDRDLCIGAAPCIAVSPETFELDDENKAIVIDPNAVDDDTLMRAAQSCPTQAIKLVDGEGNEM